jgi:glycosyltransferase involved in cell wall biosynthesis
MRVIHTINVRWFNATAWYGLYLAKLMQEAGHEVLVLTLANTESHAKALEWGLDARPLPLNSANPLTLARLYRELGRLVRDFRPDVIDCHRGESFVLFGLLRKLVGGFKLVRTRGDQRPPRNNAINRLLHGSCADAVVATNSAMAAYFKRVFGLPESRVATIIGGVDTERFAFDPAGRERVRAEFGLAESDFTVGLMGRFDKVKGQREAIRATARLKAEGARGFKLMLLGFPTAVGLEQVREWIREAGVEQDVVITGEREDLAACISAMDLGLVASLWSESIARAALEIMACGAPLVGTRVGVMPDLLDDEALVEPADPDALAEGIGRAMADADFRERLRKSQAERMAGLGAGDFLDRTLDLFREA